MELLLAFVIGGLFAAGLYSILRRSIVRIAIGLVLLGHAANLLIFTAARLTRYQPPIVAPDAELVVQPAADPLPQAMILTAIVISFGVLVFALVLIHRVYQVVGSDDLDELTTTDRPDE
jgi:multicomponent Na+:H+ antiporter subunit C